LTCTRFVRHDQLVDKTYPQFYAMHDPIKTDRTQRAPNGCSAQLRISCTQAERDRVLELARRDRRSASATACLLLRRGFDALESDRADDRPASLAS